MSGWTSGSPMPDRIIDFTDPSAARSVTSSSNAARSMRRFFHCGERCSTRSGEWSQHVMHAALHAFVTSTCTVLGPVTGAPAAMPSRTARLDISGDLVRQRTQHVTERARAVALEVREPAQRIEQIGLALEP